jgi:predicted short-subunit dehydrogenase-like oxidoreductase (DUF2520 family)
MMKVVIIGSGNVATVFAKLLHLQQHKIVQVYSKQLLHAQQLAEMVDATAIDDVALINHSADIYILALADKAIESIASQLKLNNQLVVHTAGSVSINVLQQVSENYGVLYPIQSIRKEMSLSTPIPFAVDGSSVTVIVQLIALAKTLHPNVVHYNDEQRLKLHVAAIFACNFVNYMYVQSASFCASEHLDFTVLQSLIEETANRLQLKHPTEVFTGPAVRGDVNTINKHLELLQAYPNLQELYKMLSEQIMGQFKVEDRR